MSLEELREQGSRDIDSLDMPGSIRTPGRTWTRYPELDVSGTREYMPEVEVEGDAEVFTGAEAVEEAGKKLFDAVKRDENRLTALHAAQLNSLVFLRIQGEAGARIVYGKGDPVSCHLVVDATESSEATVTEEFKAPGLTTSLGEFYVGENASLTYGSVNSSGTDFCYTARKAVVERDAEMNWLNAVFGPKKSRTRVETVLNGDNSSTEKLAAWYATGEQHTDISMKVRHIGENTRCDMDSRAVADDRARSVYEGLQKVEATAPDTQSFQNEKVLTLSEKSEVDASPKLKIENNDVEASHAATTGNVDPEKLHYLKSRGLTEREARRLVVKGFFEPLMDRVTVPELKKSIRAEVDRKLG